MPVTERGLRVAAAVGTTRSLSSGAGYAPARAIDRTAFSYYFPRLNLGEPRQGAERPSALGEAQHGDPPNLIQVMLA